MTFSTQPFLRKTLFLAALFIVGFKGFSQNKLITVHLNNKPISLIIKMIEEQSGFTINYKVKTSSASQLSDLNVDNATLENALTTLFKGQNSSFYIQKNQVVVTDAMTNQERFIRGTVLNAKDKSPLAGATIYIKGTKMGALTDASGKFTYKLSEKTTDKAVLEVRYLGMQTQTRKIGNATDFLFYLEESTGELDTVIITSSYGTKKLKEEVVGSIVSLNAKDIAIEQTSESIDKILVGQIAGVLIENTSGIGGSVKINIRGQGSLSPLSDNALSTSTQPLIIIDGVILTEQTRIDSQFFNGGRFSEDLSNPLAMISPDNIETFTVLKDAAAVGLYGADGANGVILITTKKGKLGKTKFGFSNQLGISSAVNQIKYLNGPQYTELRNEFLKNTSTGYVPVPYKGIDTNWFDLLNKTGIYNKYNFSVSGATPAFSYRTNITYLKIDEPQVGNTTRQLNVGINLGYKFSKWEANLSVNPSYIKKNAPNTYYNFAYIPTISPYNANGGYSNVGVAEGGNPLAGIAQNRNETESKGVLGSFSLGYKWNEVLRFSTLFGLDYLDKEQDRYFSGENESGQLNGSFVLNGITYNKWGRRVLNNRNSTKWNWQGQVLLDKKINKNNTIDGVLGFELAEEKGNLDYATGIGFVNPNVVNAVEDAVQDDKPASPLENERLANQIRQSEINRNSRVSLFSQFNYNYKKKYYLLANFRRDQSSVFGDDTDVALNSGLGLGWIISNESFLESNSWIDFLKLKASYGSTGNSRIGSYRSKGLYNVAQNGYGGGLSASPSEAPNGKLTWEKNIKFNVGFDFNVFKTIELSVEYYHNNLTDLITSRDVPTETGYSTMQLNASNMYNKGFEFSTKIKWFQKDKFKWSTLFNIATVNNKVTRLSGLGNDFSIAERALAQKVGYSTSTIWGIQWVGIDPATGRDLVTKNGQIYDSATYDKLFTIADWEPIADKQPRASGGFSNRISWNKISFSINGDFQWGGNELIKDDIISKTSSITNRNMSINAYDYWRTQGEPASQPVPSAIKIFPNKSNYIYDATYIRINNINISYDVPITKSFLESLVVFADVTNVAYWYKEKSPAGMNGIREFNYTYPQARTISFGVNAKF